MSTSPARRARRPSALPRKETVLLLSLTPQFTYEELGTTEKHGDELAAAGADRRQYRLLRGLPREGARSGRGESGFRPISRASSHDGLYPTSTLPPIRAQPSASMTAKRR